MFKVRKDKPPQPPTPKPPVRKDESYTPRPSDTPRPDGQFPVPQQPPKPDPRPVKK